MAVESIKYQTIRNTEFEVIIVDDGSDDGTIDYLNREELQFAHKVIRQCHKGRAGARNRGIEEAKYEIIIFMDDDMILDKNFIRAHIVKHEEKEQIVHGKIFNLPRTKFFEDPIEGTFFNGLDIRPSVRERLKEEKILPQMIRDEKDFSENIIKKSKMAVLEELISYVLKEHPGKMDWISFVGGNVSAPRRILKEVHGFDEAFGFVWGCEDIELGYRLMRKGMEFCYSDEAINYHITHYRADFARDHAINLDYFYKKYEDPMILLFHEFITEKISKDEMLQQILNAKER